MNKNHLPKRLVVRSLVVAFGFALGISGCIPAHLQKYRKSGQQMEHRDDPVVAVDPLAAQAPAVPGIQASPALRPPEPATRATIYAIDKHTFRFEVREAEVWSGALDVLMRNYNLTIVDRQNGIITTEWDSYFLDKAVYRNRVSLRVAKNGYGGVDLTVHNNVERLRDASQATETVGAVWLPAEDPAAEVRRLVQNLALVLNQPPPTLPSSSSSSVARSASPTANDEKL